MRELFRQGLAYPTDCDDYGTSLLQVSLIHRTSEGPWILIFHQYAAELGQFDVVLELLDYNAGADWQAVRAAADWTIYKLGLYPYLSASSRALGGISLYQYLVSRGFFDSIEDRANDWLDSEGEHAGLWLIQASPNLELFLKLLKHCSPLHYSLPAWERAKPLTFTRSPYRWRPAALRHLLHPSGAIQAHDLRLSLEGGCSVLHLTAFHWGFAMSYDRAEKDREFNQPWLDTMKGMMLMVDDLHSCESTSILRFGDLDYRRGSQWTSHNRTALFWFLFGFSYWGERNAERWIRRVRLAFLFWLEALEESQVDLKEYGRKELTLFMADDQLRSARWPLNFFDNPYSHPREPILTGFRYGDRAGDWVFEWDMPIEELAGEFWGMIESGETADTMVLDIPGSWVEEED